MIYQVDGDEGAAYFSPEYSKIIERFGPFASEEEAEQYLAAHIAEPLLYQLREGEIISAETRSENMPIQFDSNFGHAGVYAAIYWAQWAALIDTSANSFDNTSTNKRWHQYVILAVDEEYIFRTTETFSWFAGYCLDYTLVFDDEMIAAVIPIAAAGLLLAFFAAVCCFTADNRRKNRP